MLKLWRMHIRNDINGNACFPGIRKIARADCAKSRAKSKLLEFGVGGLVLSFYVCRYIRKKKKCMRGIHGKIWNLTRGHEDIFKDLQS